MDKLKWILVAGGPVLVLFLGGLIMFVFGYRGYGLKEGEWGQTIGMIVAILGALWFVLRLGKIIISWFTK